MSFHEQPKCSEGFHSNKKAENSNTVSSNISSVGNFHKKNIPFTCSSSILEV